MYIYTSAHLQSYAVSEVRLVLGIAYIYIVKAQKYVCGMPGSFVNINEHEQEIWWFLTVAKV